MSISEMWIAFSSLSLREVRRFMRIWIQTLVPPVITAALYFLIFGALIGSRIGPMGGHTYMEFVTPGLIMLSVITNSYANVVSSVFGNRFQRNIEEMLVSPMPVFIILLGFTIGGVARGLLVGLLVILLTTLFVDLQYHSIAVTVSMVFLTSLLFSLAGLINGIYARTFDDVSVIPTFVLTPLIYLGGVFYSVSLLPPFWQTLSHANPILYMVNAFRYGMLGTSDISVALAYWITILFIILAAGLSMYLLVKGRGIRL